MLKIMRKYQRSWVIKVIFGAIIVTFVLFFGYGALSEKEKSVAVVGQYKVSEREYQEAYDKIKENYRRLFQSNLDEKTMKELKIEDQAMDQIVNTYLLLIAADELGVAVSDGEFTDFLNSIDAFKKDGKFNEEQYLAVLRANRIDPVQFRESTRREILMRKTASIIQDTGTLSDESDVWAAYVKDKGKVKLSYALFDPSVYRDKVSINEKELLDLYEKEKSAFRGENTYRLKLLVVDEKGTLKDDVVYMDLLKGKELEAYGKEKGFQVTDLGEMKESDLIRQFKGLKITDLREMKKKGDISRLLRTAEGKSHIFQLVDMTEGKDLDKTLALAKIKDRLISEKAKTMAKAAAETAIKDKSFVVKGETGFILRSARSIEGLGEIGQDSKGVLSLSQSKTIYDNPVEIAGKYYVFSYKDEQLPDRQGWEKEKGEYAKYFMAKNRMEFFDSFLSDMKKRVKVSDNRKRS